MKRALAALLLCLAILLGIVGNASGAAITFDAKNCVGVSDSNPNIRTYMLGSLEQEPQRGDTIVGYDPATGVVFYVNQNPWSKFDPLGLWLMEMMPKCYRDAANNPLTAMITPGAMALTTVDGSIDGVISGGGVFSEGANHFTNPGDYAYAGGDAERVLMGTAGLVIGVGVIAGEAAGVFDGGGKKKAAEKVIEAVTDPKTRNAVVNVVETAKDVSNGKPLKEWLKGDPELLDEARTMHQSAPEWHGIDPDRTNVFYRGKSEVDAIRAKPGESGGHHPHGLALGGPEGQKLTRTAETRTVKNPRHSEATGLQRRIINRIKKAKDSDES